MSSDLITKLVSSGLVHVTDRIINQYLTSAIDVCHFEQVCWAWNSLILDEFHWKYKYDNQYSLDPEPEPDNRRYFLILFIINLFWTKKRAIIHFLKH